MMEQLIEPQLQKVKAYVPGLSLSAMKMKYGHDKFIKLASNESAFGASHLAISAAQAAMSHAHRYPNEKRDELKKKICEYIATPGIEPHHLTLGNGSNEIISLISRTFLVPDDIILTFWPSFIVYRLSAASSKCKEIAIPIRNNFEFDTDQLIANANGSNADKIKVLYIANPNNPTGSYISSDRIFRLINSIPEHIIVVIDEAYYEYVTAQDFSTCLPWVLKRPRTVVLRTFSKIFGLAGLRIGYGVCDPQISKAINQAEDPFNVNCVAQEAAIAAIADQAHVAIGRANNTSQMIRLENELGELGIETEKSVANFFLMRLTDKMRTSEWLAQEFLQRGVIVRTVNEYDLPRHIRVSVGTPDEVTFFLSATRDILNRA